MATFLSVAASVGGARADGGVAAAGEGVARGRQLMGTRLAIEVSTPASETAIEAAFVEVARLEQVMSNWSETSEISRLNREAFARPVLCSGDLFGAVASAIHWAEATDGAFDPTVEPLVRWFRLRDPHDRVPGGGEGEANDVAAAGEETSRAPIGWRHVRMDAGSRLVRFDAAGTGIDLGGIGKGIALDAAAGVLRAHGVRSALLDFGGQVLAIGAPSAADGWLIGIADPEDRDRPADRLLLRDGSVATSGNGERSVQGPDGPMGHILDPQRRAPASFTGTVTVAAPDATTADALSTALFVMGPRRGARWAEERGVAAAYLWRGSGGAPRSRMSSSFRRLLERPADR